MSKPPPRKRGIWNKPFPHSSGFAHTIRTGFLIQQTAHDANVHDQRLRAISRQPARRLALSGNTSGMVTSGTTGSFFTGNQRLRITQNRLRAIQLKRAGLARDRARQAPVQVPVVITPLQRRIYNNRQLAIWRRQSGGQKWRQSNADILPFDRMRWVHVNNVPGRTVPRTGHYMYRPATLRPDLPLDRARLDREIEEGAARAEEEHLARKFHQALIPPRRHYRYLRPNLRFIETLRDADYNDMTGVNQRIGTFQRHFRNRHLRANWKYFSSNKHARMAGVFDDGYDYGEDVDFTPHQSDDPMTMLPPPRRMMPPPRREPKKRLIRSWEGADDLRRRDADADEVLTDISWGDYPGHDHGVEAILPIDDERIDEPRIPDRVVRPGGAVLVPGDRLSVAHRVKHSRRNVRFVKHYKKKR